jgi:DNA-binding CsgD family transcriptional regulator
MNPSDVAESFIELGESTESSLEQLKSGFRKAIEELEFRYFSFCSHVDPLNPPPHAIILHNYPVEWIRHFSASKYYAIDPVLKRAERHLYPFFWDSVFATDQISARQRTILSEAADFGLAHGYTVPINTPWIPVTLRASCSVIPDSVGIGKDHYLAVQVIALYFHTFICAKYAPWPSVTRAELTDRERECLMLAGAGMNDREIAKELGLAGTTVHSHIRNSMLRYGVHRRIQAIMRAVMSGEILLGDLALRWDAGNRAPSIAAAPRQGNSKQGCAKLAPPKSPLSEPPAGSSLGPDSAVRSR